MEKMKQPVLLGLDVDQMYTQISYYSDEVDDVMFYPNILFYSDKTKQWYAGEEAQQRQEQELGTMLQDWEQLLKEQTILVQKESYDAKQLFIKMLALHIKNLDRKTSIARIAITAKETQFLFPHMEIDLNRELEEEVSVYCISHATAFTSFVLHQEECTGVKNVGLFQYEGEELFYHYLGRTVAGDMLQVLQIPLYEEWKEAKGQTKDERFASMMVDLFYRYKTSIVYLMGDGFDGDWMEKTLQVLCHNRRAFIGQNLFAKGAVYFALEESAKRNPKLLANNLCLYDIGVAANVKGQAWFMPILGGGCDWYGRKACVQMIVEEGEEIEIVYQNLRTKEVEKESMKLDGIPKRPPMTTKVEMEIVYTSNHTGYIKIKDLGFGELYPTSHRIWIKQFDLEDYL